MRTLFPVTLIPTIIHGLNLMNEKFIDRNSFGRKIKKDENHTGMVMSFTLGWVKEIYIPFNHI